MKNNNTTKMHRIMEIVWLILFIGSGLWLLIEYFRSGYNYQAVESYTLIPLIALAMYFFRKFFRKRMEAREKREGE